MSQSDLRTNASTSCLHGCADVLLVSCRPPDEPTDNKHALFKALQEEDLVPDSELFGEHQPDYRAAQRQRLHEMELEKLADRIERRIGTPPHMHHRQEGELHHQTQEEDERTSTSKKAEEQVERSSLIALGANRTLDKGQGNTLVSSLRVRRPGTPPLSAPNDPHDSHVAVIRDDADEDGKGESLLSLKLPPELATTPKEGVQAPEATSPPAATATAAAGTPVVPPERQLSRQNSYPDENEPGLSYPRKICTRICRNPDFEVRHPLCHKAVIHLN